MWRSLGTWRRLNIDGCTFDSKIYIYIHIVGSDVALRWLNYSTSFSSNVNEMVQRVTFVFWLSNFAQRDHCCSWVTDEKVERVEFGRFCFRCIFQCDMEVHFRLFRFPKKNIFLVRNCSFIILNIIILQFFFGIQKYLFCWIILLENLYTDRGSVWILEGVLWARNI